MKRFKVYFFVLLCTLQIASSFKILTILLLANRSNMNYFDPIHLELAKRGHSITVVTPTVGLVKHPNIKELQGIDFTKLVKGFVQSKASDLFQMRLKHEHSTPMFLTLGPTVISYCDSFYQLPAVQDLINGNEKFDLVMTMTFMNECVYGVIDKLNTSSVLVGTIPAMPWNAEVTGSPTPLSYVPHVYFAEDTDMTFTQRLGNFLSYLYQIAARKYVYLPGIENVYRKYVPNAKSAEEIQRNMSMAITAGHFTFGPKRPVLPDLVDEIGGVQCRPAEPLPTEIAEMIKGEDGKTEKDFIFFSLGSVVQGHQVPEYLRDILVKTFGKFSNYTVLWKWEDDRKTFELPPNVKQSKWFPQQDLLGHPKCKLFISHGGLSSIHEAVYHGVPIIGIPFIGDQDWNVKQIEEMGVGMKLELSEITEDLLTSMFQKILHDDHSYSINMRRQSELFRDRQNSPLEKAVWWLEYVLRHGGATHLRSPARDLNLIQYYSVDIIIFLSVCGLAAILLVCKLLSKLVNIFRGTVTQAKSKAE